MADRALDPTLIALGPDLPTRAVERLGTIARRVTVSGGETLLQEGHPTPHLGVVIDGRLAVRAWVAGHPFATLMTLDAGDVFGWSAVLDGPATATIIVLEQATVLLFERDALREVLASDPELAAALYRRLLEVIDARLAATRLQMLDLYGTGGPGR
jgi:CRP-like cAMP-binding protein